MIMKSNESESGCKTKLTNKFYYLLAIVTLSLSDFRSSCKYTKYVMIRLSKICRVDMWFVRMMWELCERYWETVSEKSILCVETLYREYPGCDL